MEVLLSHLIEAPGCMPHLVQAAGVQDRTHTCGIGSRTRRPVDVLCTHQVLCFQCRKPVSRHLEFGSLTMCEGEDGE